MIEEIKKALENATKGPWEFGVFEDSRHVIYDSTFLSRHIAEIVRGGVENEQREEDNAFLIANAPTWLRWQNERIEQLEKDIAAKDKQIAEESKRADFWQKEQFNVREANLKLVEQIAELTKRLDSVARIIDSDVSGGPYEYDPLKVKWIGEYRSFKAGDTK